MQNCIQYPLPLIPQNWIKKEKNEGKSLPCNSPGMSYSFVNSEDSDKQFTVQYFIYNEVALFEYSMEYPGDDCPCVVTLSYVNCNGDIHAPHQNQWWLEKGALNDPIIKTWNDGCRMRDVLKHVKRACKLHKKLGFEKVFEPKV